MNAPETVESAIRAILSRVLEREIAPGETVERAAEAGWDSLKHVEILFQIEDTLDLGFDEAEMAELDSLAKLVASAERHLAP